MNSALRVAGCAGTVAGVRCGRVGGSKWDWMALMGAGVRSGWGGCVDTWMRIGKGFELGKRPALGVYTCCEVESIVAKIGMKRDHGWGSKASGCAHA